MEPFDRMAPFSPAADYTQCTKAEPRPDADAHDGAEFINAADGNAYWCCTDCGATWAV